MRWIIAVLLACAACGGKSPTGGNPSGDEVGTYALVSLNGQLLPATVAEGGTQMVVRSGAITLQAGGKLTSDVSFRVATDSTWLSSPLTGTYVRQGNTLSFSYSNGGAASATLAADTLRFANEGVVWQFLKQ